MTDSDSSPRIRYRILPRHGESGTGGTTTDRQEAFNAAQNGHDVIPEITIEGIEEIEEADR